MSEGHEDSEKVRSLQVKLAESEATISSLKSELEAKASQASLPSGGDASASQSAAEAVRAEFTAKIEQMTIAHADQTKTLQEQLTDAGCKQKELEEKLDRLENDHAMQLRNLGSEHTQKLEALEATLKHTEHDHMQALEALRASHSSDLDKAGSDASESHKAALSELEQKHALLVSAKHELESIHAKQIESHQAELAAALERHAKELASQNETRTAEIVELQNQLKETESKLKDGHEAELKSKLGQGDAEHSKGIEALLTAQEDKLSGLRSELETSHQSKVKELEVSHHAELDDLKEQLAQALKGGSTVDELKAKVGELEGKLADNEKIREQVEKKAAAEMEEVHGKHASELSKLATEKSELQSKHQVASDKAHELEKSMASSEKVESDLKSALDQLSASKDESSRLNTQVSAMSAEIHEARTQRKEMEKKLSEGERSLNDQIERNMTLLNQLGEIDGVITASRRRVRELEAEITSLKAEKENSGGIGRDSKSEDDDATKGEARGPSIQGTVGQPSLIELCCSFIPFPIPSKDEADVCASNQMKSIQEQIKQIQSTDSVWMKYHNQWVTTSF